MDADPLIHPCPPPHLPPPPLFHLFTRRDAAALACLCRSARAAARASKWADAVRISRDGWVLEPASGNFAAEVAPGESLQEAIDRCPSKSCILLLPGTHEGSVAVAKEIHVFGRGVARLQGPPRVVLALTAATATLDGLIIHGRTALHPGLDIPAGAARVQGCALRGFHDCVHVRSGANPVLIACR